MWKDPAPGRAYTPRREGFSVTGVELACATFRTVLLMYGQAVFSSIALGQCSSSNLFGQVGSRAIQLGVCVSLMPATKRHFIVLLKAELFKASHTSWSLMPVLIHR